MANLPFNIAIIGAWNPAIFNPDWVKNNLAVDPTSDVMFSISFGAALPPKITVEGINLYPSPNALIIDFDLPVTREKCLKAVELARKTVSLLSHTPLSAVGVNCRYYLEPTSAGKVVEQLCFEDAIRIDSKKYTYTRTDIRRSFDFEGCILNLSISSDGDQDTVEFNFHLDTPSAEKVVDFLNENNIDKFVNETKKFLSDVYSLDLEFFNEN